ncbi:uncharacterized protein [Phyllobates terribilis]|uniref:uncharacterized protein n=1 Tax=Phyllobates terribilis TaxID=111132 RepID=UPI003CCB01AD
MQGYTRKAMAGHLDSDLKEITGCMGSKGYFKENKLLLLQEVHSILEEKNHLNEAGEAMLGYMKIRHEYHYMQVPFPITKVQHVTTAECMSDILESQCFSARSRKKYFEDLTFWSAQISKDDINTAFEDAYQSIQGDFSPQFLSQYKQDIRDQFANSPAFKNFESRYGSFMFSFSLSDLLDLYETQHCGSKKPLFKYLGTDLFKKEIAHYIVIHSPDTDEFDDLQQVPRFWTDVERPVYWTEQKLYWRPESTSEKLTVLFSQYFLRKLEYEKFCVWNNLVFAFHLPEGRSLRIQREQLLENLSACHATVTPYLGVTKNTREEAIEIIESKKRHYEYN